MQDAENQAIKEKQEKKLALENEKEEKRLAKNKAYQDKQDEIKERKEKREQDILSIIKEEKEIKLANGDPNRIIHHSIPRKRPLSNSLESVDQDEKRRRSDLPNLTFEPAARIHSNPTSMNSSRATMIERETGMNIHSHIDKSFATQSPNRKNPNPSNSNNHPIDISDIKSPTNSPPLSKDGIERLASFSKVIKENESNTLTLINKNIIIDFLLRGNQDFDIHFKPGDNGVMEIELNVTFVVDEDGVRWREALFIILDFTTSKWKKVKRKHRL